MPAPHFPPHRHHFRPPVPLCDGLVYHRWLLQARQMESLISFLKKTFFPLLFLIGCMWLNAEYQSPEPLWQQLGRSFLQGFVAAPYQDTPIDQMLSLSDVALPHPRLEASASHPRMYGKTLSPAQILTRLEQEPYQSWAINMQAAASAYPYDLSQPYLFEGYRSTGAKLNSFCYVITGEQHYLDVAKTALLSIGETYQPTTPEGEKAIRAGVTGCRRPSRCGSLP